MGETTESTRDNFSKKVFVVGMLDSIHLARWVSQFIDEPLKLYLYPSGPQRKVHPLIRRMAKSPSSAKIDLIHSVGPISLIVWIIDRFLDLELRGWLIRRKINKLQPDFVHALELQNAGYSVLAAFKGLESSKRPELIITNYGSDIVWFSRFPSHRDRLSQLLQITDLYGCECNRDVELAKDLGFKGRIAPVFPNAGGFSKKDLSKPFVASQMKQTIAVKGYQGWVGRAIAALDAIELIADQLRNCKIELYSCNRSTIRRAKKLKRTTGLQVQWSAKGRLHHDQMMDLFRRSKVYVGISESDGISTSLLEAMACGAIPVQTSTACCDEWFTDTGVRVDSISPEAVAEAILAALELAKDPSNAERNRQTIKEKASEEKVKAAALQYYR